jgi:hypothetical protein
MAKFGICGTNSHIIDNLDINLTYDDILSMNDAQFFDYVQRMRALIRDVWNTYELAPAAGWTEARVREDFEKLASFSVNDFWRVDELSGRRCIHNTHTLGNAVNAWNLSRMLKTRINYTEKDEGRSIYDFFNKDELFKKYLPYARRHFLRDSFFFFAQTVKRGDSLPHREQIKPQTALEWVTLFNEHEAQYGTHGLLIDPRPKGQKDDYTGYAEHLRTAEFLAFTYAEFKAAAPLFRGASGLRSLRLLQAKHFNDDHEFHIRMYEKGQKLFPAMFKSFRISMCQVAVNFPPLTAKLLYETFLPETPEATIWDPSSGWGGRILGAMSTDKLVNGQTQKVHYIGTDPNSSLYADGTSVYASIADFYNNLRSGQSLFGEHHTYQVFQHGSENALQQLTALRKTRGRGDLVFTSPPYYNREAYSEDSKQSYKKYPAYDSWRDGFLRDTLAGVYEWLGHNRYCLWNIADLKLGGTKSDKYLPLEQDSKKIAHELGFEFVETIYMTLRNMPGANRVGDDGDATTKNFCKIDGRLTKFEPVHVFKKN